MDIQDYDPRVLPQLLEFMHRYILDVLADSQLFAEHAGRTEVEVDDVRLAVEGKVAHSFTSVPSREVVEEVAAARNATPLPLMQEKFGIRLPPERNCLTGTNFNIVPQRAKAAEPAPSSSSQPLAGRSSGGTPAWMQSQHPSNHASLRPPTAASAMPTAPYTIQPIIPQGLAPAPPPLMMGSVPNRGAQQSAAEDDYDDMDED
ncbi:Transcription initiation factor TFIID subunit 9B [Irineochytrium annulatum]|nr:Transcription initiation factor TFIID subunit 9B [Irineochytrium annulatum]